MVAIRAVVELKRPIISGALCALLAVLAGPLPWSCADVFHLARGGTIEGMLLAEENGQYTIRTTIGTVRIAAADVERIERAPTVFEEYEQRAGQAGDTPAAQVALATWCAGRGLRAERTRHLQRAIELDPDCAAARRALGFVKVGTLWVDGRRVAADRKDEPQPEAEPEPERLARAIQGQWFQRIRAIKSAQLDSQLERLNREGREKILEIRDPLAIYPLATVLGGGGPACRRLLVESLAQFPEDEATMNLALLALLDPVPEIRNQALEVVAARQDPRVIAQYRAALRAGDDAIQTRAAAGLGALEAREAVPDLIAALTTVRNKWVEMPVRTYIGSWPQVFTRTSGVTLSSGVCVGCRPRVGVYTTGNVVAPDVKNEWRYGQVTVYRTEVLEALRRITGQDFGFDRSRWQRWYEESES